MAFNKEPISQLPAAEPRHTKDIRNESPCNACALRHAAIYARVNAKDFSSLILASSTVYLDSKQTLFSEDDDAEFLYTVSRGTLMVYKTTPDGRRQVTGFLFNGDILGLSSEGRYVRSAETITECTLYEYICKVWTKQPERFRLDPIHQMPGLNN